MVRILSSAFKVVMAENAKSKRIPSARPQRNDSARKTQLFLVLPVSSYE
jgi:hypothetical protein